MKNPSGNHLYFIGITPDNSASQQLKSYQLALFEKYDCKHALKSPPHLTLVPPFALAAEQEPSLILDLETMPQSFSSLKIIISGIKSFDKRVIYAAPIVTESLQKLQQEIFTYFGKYVSGKVRAQFMFTPHFTIANRDIRVEDFPDIMAYLQSQSIEFQASLDKIHLFKFQQGKWHSLSHQSG